MRGFRTVKGAAALARWGRIALSIDGELCFQRENFLEIPMGKIGFRNWSNEEAHVRRVRVRPIN